MRSASIAFLGGGRNETLHSVHLLDVEFAQVLRRLVRERTLAPERAEEAIEDLMALRITRYAPVLLLNRIWPLRHNLSAYDAAHVALAEELHAPLITRDQKLAAAPGMRLRSRCSRLAKNNVRLSISRLRQSGDCMFRGVGWPQPDLDIDPLAKSVDDRNQAVNRKSAEIGVANSGEIGGGDACPGLCGTNGEAFKVKDLENLSCEDGLELLNVSALVAEIAKDISAAANDLNCVFSISFFSFHLNCSFRPLRRFTIRSISDFGVLIPCFAFFWNA